MDKKDFILKLDNALSRVIELKRVVRKGSLMYSYLDLAQDFLTRSMVHADYYDYDTYKIEDLGVVENVISEGVVPPSCISFK